MALTREAEETLQLRLDTIGEANWHESDREAAVVLKALKRTRLALKAKYNEHERGAMKTGADCTVLVALKSVRLALEGEA